MLKFSFLQTMIINDLGFECIVENHHNHQFGNFIELVIIEENTKDNIQAKDD